MMLIRSLCGHACFVCFNSALAFAPMFIIVIIFQTNPFWTGVLSAYLNNEKVERVEQFCMLLCFACVCSIAYSSIRADQSVLKDPQESSDNGMLLGILIILVASWAFSINVVLVRYLKEIEPSVIMFYHSTFGIIAATLIILSQKVLAGKEFNLAQVSPKMQCMTCLAGLLDSFTVMSLTIAF
jgi:drug/metabolite transporter (DMT)-like permease